MLLGRLTQVSRLLFNFPHQKSCNTTGLALQDIEVLCNRKRLCCPGFIDLKQIRWLGSLTRPHDVAGSFLSEGVKVGVRLV